MGLNFATSMGESARLRNIAITGNQIGGFQRSGILLNSAYRDMQGDLDARDVSISNNVFEVGPAGSVRIRGVRNLVIEGNRFTKDGKPLDRSACGISIRDCPDSRVNQ